MYIFLLYHMRVVFFKKAKTNNIKSYIPYQTQLLLVSYDANQGL